MCALSVVGRQNGFIHVGSDQYLIEPVKGHSKDVRQSGHPHLVYRRSAVHHHQHQHHHKQQQQQQQPVGTKDDHVRLCGLDDRGESLGF